MKRKKVMKIVTIGLEIIDLLHSLGYISKYCLNTAWLRISQRLLCIEND